MASKTLKLSPLNALDAAAECLRTLSHPLRLRMVQMLLQEEFTVGELAEACEIPSHMASEHLGKMKDRGLLSAERRGRNIYYGIAEPGLAGIVQCVERRFG
ncbi:MAG: winged helix-turn-helix transcriptional regulator [Candidatus Hydrogenedentes bacterium]|nr:winged helix-turn-helix transcriptional regulator [Candidatus Hydrogenedentota bacterium]